MGEVADFFGDVFDAALEGSMQIGEALGYPVKSKKTKARERRAREAAEAARPRRPASIDDAALRQQESDRVRRRRGVLANVYGGANPTAPSVATKQLLGQ